MKLTETLDNTYSFNANTIVQAGAGTGKTSALINLYLQLLEGKTNLNYPLKIDEIVAITFTEKAANEMKERTRIAIDKKIVGDAYMRPSLIKKQNDLQTLEFWKNLKEEFFKANINTIHGFCSSILREYSMEANIDKDFSVLAELEANIILEDLIDSFLKEKIKNKDKEVTRLLYDYGLNSSTYMLGLKDSLLTIYQKMREVDWLDNKSIADFSMEENRYYQNLTRIIKDLNDKIKLVEPLFVNKQEDYKNLLESWNRFKKDILSSKDSTPSSKPPLSSGLLEQLVRMEEFFNLKGLPRNLTSKDGKFNLSDLVKEIREIITSDKTITGLIPMLSQILSYSSINSLYQLISEIEEIYKEEKARLNCVDFSDLQILTQTLIRDNLEVRKELKDKFKAILVDEFQDTNALQQQIIFYLAENKNNEGVFPDIKLSDRKLFLIGDPKQSIYKFRGADVTIFNKVKSKILKDNPGANFLSSNTNYRSQRPIINFVNALFSNVLTPFKKEKKDFEIDYIKENHQINANRCDTDSKLVEIIELDKEAPIDQARSVEAEILAQRILEIVKGQQLDFNIYDKNGKSFRPSFKDFAILLHKFTRLDIYEDALKKFNIPYYVVKGRGFYKNQEILDIYNFLSFLINPLDTLALVGILRSPFFEISDEGIYLLKCRERSQPFPMGLSDFDKKKFSDALDLFKELNVVKDRISISELIELILDKTNYIAIISATTQGIQKVANIKKLIRIASDFERKTAFSLREFIIYLERLINTEPLEADLQILNEEENVVQIMTIHQAKGLQFPIVIIPDIGQTTPLSIKDRIIFNEESGVAIKVYSTEILSYKNTSTYNKIVEQEKEKDIAESKRLFYVATTRAKDYLIISSSKSNKVSQNSWFYYIQKNYEKLSPFIIQKKLSDSQIQVENGLKTSPTLFEKFKDTIIDGREIVLKSHHKEEFAEQEKLITRITEPHKPPTNELILSTTSINNYVFCERFFYFEDILKIKTERVIKGTQTSDSLYEKSALELGSIVHKILEFLDIKIIDKDITTEIEDLCKSLKPDISAEESKNLASDIKKLLQSKDFEKIKNAKRIYREVPFSLSIQDENYLRFYINGKIDLFIENKDNTFSIIDYKYASFNENKSVKRYLTQLFIYYYALSTNKNVVVDSVYLVFLKDNPHFEKIKLESLETIKHYLLKIGQEIIDKLSKEDEKYWKRCEDQKLCVTCHYNALCNEFV